MAAHTPRTGSGFLDAALDPPPTVLGFAHRGGSRHPEVTGLENTRAAFAHAVSLGYAYLETDVHLTADGVLLACHDERLDRVSDGSGRVSALTAAQVRRVRVGGTEPVPTLAELFEALPRARFNIDLKAPGTPAALVRLLAEHDAWHRVLVGSFSVRRVREFRRLSRGRVPTSAHPGEVLAFRLLPSARLAGLLSGSSMRALQIPYQRHGLVICTPGLVRRAHRVGRHVHVWTIDDPDRMRMLLARGVDGLMTDRTDVLRSVLVEHGAWRDDW